MKSNDYKLTFIQKNFDGLGTLNSTYLAEAAYAYKKAFGKDVDVMDLITSNAFLIADLLQYFELGEHLVMVRRLRGDELEFLEIRTIPTLTKRIGFASDCNFANSNICYLGEYLQYNGAPQAFEMSKLVKAPKLIHNLDQDKATNISSMFAYCSYLEECPDLNDITSEVTNASNLFESCNSLIQAPKMNLEKCVYVDYMFNYCTELLYAPRYKFADNAKGSDIFSGCSKLQSVGGIEGFCDDLNLEASIRLSRQSILNVLETILPCGDSGYTITFSNQVRNKLSTKEWAKFTEKGYIIAFS